MAIESIRNVTTAVVGCGYWGRNLVRNFAALSDLRVCCDTSQEIRSGLENRLPGVTVTSSYTNVLEDERIEAIALATPAITHAEMALAALDAGKHVFVEKPLALTVADAEGVVRASERVDRILAVGHLLEYHPAVEYLKDMVQRGALGEIYYCYSKRVNLGKVRSDESALWSLAPHDISIVLYLFDEEPIDVEASGQAFVQPDVEDVVFLTLKFPSGRVANIQVSWLDPHKERQLTIVGSEKMVVFDDMKANEKIRIYDKGVDRNSEMLDYESHAELLTVRVGDIVIPRISNDEPLARECGEFLRAVVTGNPPRSDGNSGLRVVRVLEQAEAKLKDRSKVFQTR